MSEKDFPFIVLNGPKLNDPGARKVIRKQAMKDIGNARRKRGNYGKVNQRQIPVFEKSRATNVSVRTVEESEATLSPDTSDSSTSNERIESADDELPRDLTLFRKKVALTTLQSPNPLTYAAINLFSNYETARAKFSVDIADLAILTNFNVGRSTKAVLSAEPGRLASLLGYQQWSYLQFVPCLYGTSPCLTAATNCLLAKVKGFLSPYDQCKEVTIRLYAKALHTLRDAISNEQQCMNADVLCAMQLLSLHEVLDPSQDTAWSHHVNGSARLVKHRTVDRFRGEFEKALFAAHVGPMISECLVLNQACYLAESVWTELYKSLIQEKEFLDDRSALTINLRCLMFPLSGLWHDVGKAITSPQLFDDEALASLAHRCRQLHKEDIDWMEDYKAHCVRLSLVTPPPEEIAMRRELFGNALECLILTKRLLATVCDDERQNLETETQALAHLLLDLQKQPSTKHSWLFSGHEVGIAYTTIRTKDQWEETCSNSCDEERRLAIRRRYNIWDSSLRMTG